MPKYRRTAAIGMLITLALAVGAIMLPSCDSPQQSARTQTQQALRGRTDRGEALLDAAVNHLRDLPSSVTTDLHLPEIILDSTKSRDGGDVLARCTENPTVTDGLVNFLTVPARNAGFRQLGVRPGDTLKYHAGLDPESLEAGFEQRVVLELKVAQVLDDNTLLVEGTLNQPVEQPEKIEIWRFADDRLVEISRQLKRYDLRRLPAVGWQPSADAQVLDQIVVQLNQWLRQSQPKTEWKVDELLTTLPSSLATADVLKPYVSADELAAPIFQAYDGRLLQEAVWLRDISRWAHGQGFDNLARAEAIFDWTVRNIQLDDDAKRGPHRPWQVLSYGRGTAYERAWVFALLCRQQGLDVVMLAIAPEKTEGGAASDGTATAPKFWLPALVDDGQLYLFDTRLGLSIPGPDGKGVATLEEVQKDDGLLRKLDLDGMPYPITAAELKHVVAYVVADPFDMTRRVRLIEDKLSGDDRLVLAARADEVANRVKGLTGVSEVRIWDVPFQTLADQLTLGRSARTEAALAFEPFAWRPMLWKARTRHFQGRKQQVDAAHPQAPEELIDDHRDATRMYMHKSIRPTDQDIAAAGQEEGRILTAAKMDATYWLGLLSFDDKKYDVAAHWLANAKLLGTESPWSAGARYNLARTLEAQGKLDEAAAMLENDSSPQQHGNRLRAKWLRRKPNSKLVEY